MFSVSSDPTSDRTGLQSAGTNRASAPRTWRLATALLIFLTIMTLVPILAINANAEINANTQALIAANFVAPHLRNDESRTSRTYSARLNYRNDDCNDSGQGSLDNQTWPSPASAGTLIIKPKEGCDPSQYRVRVSNPRNPSTDALPVEIVVGFEPLVASSEADQTSDQELPDYDDLKKVKVPHPTPTPTPGGLSYSQAPEITAGTVSDTLVPGETKYYRVNVDWGQRSIAEVEFDKNNTGSYRSGQISIASPQRERTSATTFALLEQDRPHTAQHLATPRVFYDNRNKNLGLQEASNAGQWYVMVILDAGYEHRRPNDGTKWRQTLEPGPAPSAAAPSDNNGDGGSSIKASPNHRFLFIGLGLLATALITTGAFYLTTVRRK